MLVNMLAYHLLLTLINRLRHYHLRNAISFYFTACLTVLELSVNVLTGSMARNHALNKARLTLMTTGNGLEPARSYFTQSNLCFSHQAMTCLAL
jgi:hypothetical protein